MEKFYLRMEDRTDYEKENNKASYRTVIDRYISDLVLCNNIASLDDSIFDNVSVPLWYENEDGEEIKTEIYQYFLFNGSEWEIEQLNKYGIITSYSDKLECNVLLVDHFGTSWDYVLTDTELTENIEEI